ncbi:MAG: hypothetical protein JF591_16960 [Lysobacter sp.]|nr:hypothetical protein [Lysobacter sp.]
MIIQWAYTLKAPWGAVVILAHIVLIAALILDLDRAYRIAVGKPLNPLLPPGLFPPATPGPANKAPKRSGGRLRNGLLLAFLALVIVPSVLPSPLPGGSFWSVLLAGGGMAVALGLSHLCQTRGWRVAEYGLIAVAAACLVGMMLHRYWFAGDEGLRHYLAMVGLFAAIVTLMALSYGLMRSWPPPRTPVQAHVRFVLGLILTGLLIALFFIRA